MRCLLKGHAVTQLIACIICSSKAPRSELVNPRDQSSWITLRRAAEIHDFQPILQLPTADECIPDVFYHRECRSAFTHKKTLNSLEVPTVQRSLSMKSNEVHRGSQSSAVPECMKRSAFFVRRATNTSKGHTPENHLSKLVNFEQMRKSELWPLFRWTTKYLQSPLEN